MSCLLLDRDLGTFRRAMTNVTIPVAVSGSTI